MTLRQAAGLVRQSLKLAKTYVDSSSAAKVYLGYTIGAEKVFDAVVAPALNLAAAKAMATSTIAPETPASQSNGKTNGTSTRVFIRPVAPRVIVNAPTH